MEAKYSINEIIKMGANEDIINRLIKQIKRDRSSTNAKVIPFVGAGLSVDYGYSLWGDTIKKIANTYSVKTDHISKLLRKGRYIEAADTLYYENP